MSASKKIRAALQQVKAARLDAQTSPGLLHAVTEVKRFQALRFAATYRDLLSSKLYGQCATFFLEELYSDRDYAQRDAQFARVSSAIEAAFPAPVIATTVKLAQLHSATEILDLQMAQIWSQNQTKVDNSRYLLAWRTLKCHQARQWQLNTVLEIGEELGTLTRKRGLRLILRMMHQPAKLAGLGDLQHFLEAGFDHFAQLSKDRQALKDFLATIQRREQDWIDRLETMETAACERHITLTLSTKPK